MTTTFNQTCACLALARALKERPDPPIIIIGGGNCEGEMGLQMNRSFPWLDYVSTGEADVSFPMFLQRLLREENADPLPGILRRGVSKELTSPEPIFALDDLPIPDFSEYYQRIEQSTLKESIRPALLIETSRGCWWGAKQHCTFCGLNGNTMTFRSKSPERVFDELEHLSRTYGLKRIECVDNILDTRYINTLFPRLSESDLDIELFYEVKANLRYEQLAPEVDFAGVDGLAADIRRHYSAFGTNVRAFNLTTDLPICVMMSIAFDTTGKGPAATVGLGCNLDPKVALLRSLLEVCQTHPGEVRRFAEQRPAEQLKRYEDVITLMDHSAFLMIPEHLSEFSFLLDHGRTQSIEDLANPSVGNVQADLAICVDALRQKGCRVAYADLTTPDIVPFGMRVVRAIATGLQPMHFGFGQERLGGRRLYDVPQLIGYATAPRTEKDLNPCPHPLA